MLLNSVLSSVPAFFCSTFWLPAWANKEIDKIRRGFFWRGKRLNSGFHCLVNWNQICRPKNLGGLGVRNIRTMNEAFLMKNLWKFYCTDSLPWVRLIKAPHYKRITLSSGRKPPTVCAPFWRGILRTSAPFHTSLCYTLGDGARTPFWHATWTRESLLRDRLPTLFGAATHKNLVVKDWMTWFRTKVNLGFRPATSEAMAELSLLNSLIGSLSLTGQSDVIGWRWGNRSSFTVSSAYRFLIFDGINDTKITQLWKLRVPLKIKIFLWLGARNRIPLAELLKRRGWIGPTICSLCRQDDESSEHLFFGCNFARGVWAWIFNGEAPLMVALLAEPGGLVARWIRVRSLLKGECKSLLDLGFAACCWELWLKRNRCIFNDGRPSTSKECGSRVIECIRLWTQAWVGGDLQPDFSTLQPGS